VHEELAEAHLYSSSEPRVIVRFLHPSQVAPATTPEEQPDQPPEDVQTSAKGAKKKGAKKS
jgi:hypothetical protein